MNNNEISKELLDNKFNMMLDNQGRLVLNDQKTPSQLNEPQISPGFVKEQPPEVFCKKGVLKNFASSPENTCVEVSFRAATLLKRDSSTGVVL